MSHNLDDECHKLQDRMKVNFVFAPSDHCTRHFDGNPQGPLLGSPSCGPAAAAPVAPEAPLAPTSSFAPVLLVFVLSTFAPAPASAPGFSVSSEDSHWKALFTVSKNVRPWIVANSSSSAEGWRDPSPEAKVPAPQGEPPWTSVRSDIWAVETSAISS
jgi:hypothetical protein